MKLSVVFTSFVFALGLSSVAHAQNAGIPQTCEDFSGTYELTCMMPPLPTGQAHPAAVEIAKAFTAPKQITLVQTGCSMLNQSGSLSSIGGMDVHTISVPLANNGSFRMSYVQSSNWETGNLELKSQLTGMVQVNSQPAIPFKVVSHLRRFDANTVESTAVAQAAGQNFNVNCVYKKQ